MDQVHRKSVWLWLAMLIGLPIVLLIARIEAVPDIEPDSQAQISAAEWNRQTSGTFYMGYGNFEEFASGKTPIKFDSDGRPHLEDH